MNTLLIRNALRKVIVDATGIDPERDLQTSGMTFDPIGKDFWVQEFALGGDLSETTNQRIGSNAYLVQYDFFSPAGVNAEMAETMASQSASALLLRSRLDVDGLDCIVQKVKTSSSFNKHYSCFSVLVTLRISSMG